MYVYTYRVIRCQFNFDGVSPLAITTFHRFLNILHELGLAKVCTIFQDRPNMAPSSVRLIDIRWKVNCSSFMFLNAGGTFRDNPDSYALWEVVWGFYHGTNNLVETLGLLHGLRAAKSLEFYEFQV